MEVFSFFGEIPLVPRYPLKALSFLLRSVSRPKCQPVVMLPLLSPAPAPHQLHGLLLAVTVGALESPKFCLSNKLTQFTDRLCREFMDRFHSWTLIHPRMIFLLVKSEPRPTGTLFLSTSAC